MLGSSSTCLFSATDGSLTFLPAPLDGLARQHMDNLLQLMVLILVIAYPHFMLKDTVYGLFYGFLSLSSSSLASLSPPILLSTQTLSACIGLSQCSPGYFITQVKWSLPTGMFYKHWCLLYIYFPSTPCSSNETSSGLTHTLP